MGASQGKSNKEESNKYTLESHAGSVLIDQYPIKINNEQIANLFKNPYLYPKKTLTWKDVVNESGITFRKCVEQKIEVDKLYNMQPDIEEWVKCGKADVKDCVAMELWRPHPFDHFQCCIGDLVIHREYLPAKVLMHAGVTFETLWQRYGLRPNIMMLIKYSLKDWVKLGFEEKYLEYINDSQWNAIFQKRNKEEVIRDMKRYTLHLATKA
jgi:hypothetical protein